MAQVFRHPTSHNIEWHDILSLLNAVGTVRDTHKGHIEITIGDAVEVLEPDRHKEIETEQLAILRRLLRRGGVGELTDHRRGARARVRDDRQ